jgi:hypothetical protein
MFELQALADQHRNESVFREDDEGQMTLAPWLLDLRFRQGHEVAEKIARKAIPDEEFQAWWNRALAARKRPRRRTDPAATPNTATFGGYRLKRLVRLDRPRKGRAKKIGR